MALEEVSFYNVNGDEVNLSNLVAQMVDYYSQKLEVGETRVTDFNEGSEIRNLLEAFAVGLYALLEEQYESTRIAFISTSYGTWLDKIGELPFINLPRIEGTVSTGEVTFSIEEALSSDLLIPEGTILLSSDTGLEFVTTSDSLISTGETSTNGIVECLTTGADGNVSAESIDTINDITVDLSLVSVSNESALEQGADYEDDEAYRARLLDNVQKYGFGTLGYYKRLCEDVTGVHDVSFTTATGYTRKVLVNGDVKPTPDSVLLDVLTALSDLSNLVVGHSFTIDKPTYVTKNLTFTLNVTHELSTTNLNANLSAFVDGGNFDRISYDGLSIGESVTQEDFQRCVGLFDSVVSCSVKVTGESTAFDSISIGSGEVLKLGTITWSQTEV